MDKKQVLNILEELSAHKGIDFVAFHQFGEPLLNKDIWDFIDYSHSLKLRTQLVTNGLLLNKKNVDKLIEHPPSILRISAQVIIPEHHKEIRGVRMDFSQYIDKVSTCIARLIDEEHRIKEIRTDIAVVDNFSGLKAGKEYLKQRLGIAEIADPSIYNPTLNKLRPHLIYFLKLVDNKSENFHFCLSSLDKNITNYNDIKGFDTIYEFKQNNLLTGKRFHNGRKISQYYPVDSGMCETSILGILADGSVTLCCIDYDGKTAIGNICDNTLESIISQKRHIIEDLRKGKLYFDACRKCLGCPTKQGVFIKNAKNHLSKLNYRLFYSL